MQRLIRRIISQGGGIGDLFDHAIDDAEFQDSPILPVDEMKKYSTNLENPKYSGIVITYNDDHILVRCHTVQGHIGDYLRQYVPWESERYFECYDCPNSEINQKILKFFKQNIKRLYMKKYAYKGL